MQYLQAILLLLAVAIALSAAAPKLRIPYPILLMCAGMAIGFVPGFNYVPVKPEIIFLLFLPPLLYDAASKINFPDFRSNLGTISMLAVTMVFVTIVAIAVVARYAIPGMSWPVAFVIGAILSPPDAVAATGIIENMKLPHNTKTILEGESLVNDASALTAYRIAMGVVAGGSFVFWKAGIEFAVILAGGSVIGALLALFFFWFLRHVPLKSTATVSFNILLPFVAYQLAEMLDVSGVMAVVVMGLMIARKIHRDKVFSDATIIQSRSVWAVIIYLMSGLIFILIGMEFPQALREIPKPSIVPLIFSSLAIFLIALIIRIIFIFEHRYRVDKTRFHLKSYRRPSPDNREVGQGREAETLDWKNALVVGWSGMRGIVSVATAIALPITLSGEPFPERNSIIFLTVLVVVLMLLIQGLGLPILIRLLKIDDQTRKEEI